VADGRQNGLRRRRPRSPSGARRRRLETVPACPSCAKDLPASWHEFGHIPEPAYALAETEALLAQATAAAP
jgi:hypothetical protein